MKSKTIWKKVTETEFKDRYVYRMRCPVFWIKPVNVIIADGVAFLAQDFTQAIEIENLPYWWEAKEVGKYEGSNNRNSVR